MDKAAVAPLSPTSTHSTLKRLVAMQDGQGCCGPVVTNQYALYVEEAGGMATIYNLQQHENYKKGVHIMDKYFPDDEEHDAAVAAPRVD